MAYYEFCDPFVGSDARHEGFSQVSKRLFSTRLSVTTLKEETQTEACISLNKLEFVSLGVQIEDSASYLVLGSPYVFTYTLLLRFHRISHSSAGCEESGGVEVKWRSIDALQPSEVSSAKNHDSTAPVVSVEVCNTSSFAVVGPQRQLLSTKPLRAWKNGSPSSEVGTLGCISVPVHQQVEFSLQVCLAPLQVGALSLPPLRLTVSPSEHHSVCFPNQPHCGLMSVLSVDFDSKKVYEYEQNRRFTQFISLCSS